MSSRIEPLGVSPAAATTSRDIGDVSCFVPSGGLAVTSYAYGLPIHSWPVVAATGTSIGTKTLITAAKAIVGTAVELYLDPQLLSAVENDWSRSRGTTAFSTPIPAEQKALANIRQSFRLEIPRKCNALFFHLDNYFQIKFFHFYYRILLNHSVFPLYNLPKLQSGHYQNT